MKVGFITLGCKVNIYESNALKDELIKRGYEIVDVSEDCDCFVINTCSVTNQADSKSRKMISKCHRLNPNALLCVMGCYSQTNQDEAMSLEGIDILIGNGNKHIVADKIDEMINLKERTKYVSFLEMLKHKDYDNLTVTEYDHTRAFVKIEDGCNNFCTYCIIPYARGPVRSKNTKEVINEIKNIVSLGYKEVVLSGIHTGHYNYDGINFTKLCKLILEEVPNLERLRISSVEINEIDDEFIELLKNNQIIANHLHLPLQAGSNHILSLMHRRYNKDYFLSRINKIKEARPDISITTDIIVGFPEETEEDFKETMEFSKELGFSKIHVFPYSARRGTPAASMKQISPDIKKDRVKRLIELSDKLEEEYYKLFIGKETDVIFEQVYQNNLVGHSSNYLEISANLSKDYIKKHCIVKIIKYENKKLISELIKVIN